MLDLVKNNASRIKKYLNFAKISIYTTEETDSCGKNDFIISVRFHEAYSGKFRS
jgi:hypothetical protein